MAGERELGWIGELHPLVARAWDLDGRGAAFELDVDALAELAPAPDRSYRDVTSFPAVLQDIAVVVRRGGAGRGRWRRPCARAAASCSAGCAVFDVYRGEQVGEGNKSLALRLEFRAPDRTLTDDEVAERRAAIEARARRSSGGRLRA